MLALLSPRVWLALALAGVLAFSHFTVYRSGKATVRAEWDAAKVVQLAALADAEKAARAKEQSLQSKVTEAVNAGAKRTQKANADAAAVRRTADSLRDDLARARADMPGATCESVRKRADTYADVFGRCAAEITELAGRCDRISVDRDTLIQAWPK